MGLRIYADSIAPYESYNVRLYVNKTLFYRVAGSVALRSDCADAQDNLELHCPRISEDPVLHVAAHMSYADKSSS